MSKLDVKAVKDLLQDFDFKRLFIEELGWENPRYSHPFPIDTDEVKAQGKLIAELGGVIVMEIAHDPLPNSKQRENIHRSMRASFAERVLIFVDRERTRSCWSWVKTEGKKEHLRDHFYFKGESAEGFIGKIASLSVDLAEYDPEGRFGLQAASDKVKSALDVQRVVKRFYTSYKDLKDEFVLAIGGIDDPADRAWYASVVLNRLMFVYFLQKGLFLDGGEERYLEKKIAAHRSDFYRTFLQALFFEAFAKPQPSPEARRMCGDIPYLNGGLFRPHKLEETYKEKIEIPTEAFDPILKLFGGYSWTFNDVPEDPDKTLNPDVLGYIFEKYINQKEFGAYYTPHEITDYLCHQTIHRLILDKMADQGYKGHDSVGDMLLNLKGDGVLFLLRDVLPSISLLDPACGSGAFLYAALQTLLVIYTSAMGRIMDLKHEGLDAWRARTFAGHRSELYWLKKRIITDNLYGVDIMEEAVEIAKVRLFMALVQSARPGETLEPLPNIDFNILPGNSLIGLMRVEDEAFDKQRDATASLFGSSLDYAELVHRRNIATGEFRNPKAGSDVAQLGRDVDKLDAEALPKLNAMLLEAFRNQKVVYEEATWDAKVGKEGKPKKRAVTTDDVEALQPFHWGYGFNERFANGRGFDAIITNPPWEILKPQAKEFFAKGSKAVTKNKMTIKEFEAHRETLLAEDLELKGDYEAYLSRFPYQSAYFRSAPEYANQSAVVNGKRTGTDVNLYKLFTERCYGLLRPGGYAGIIVPTNLMKDLGSFGVRKLLFERANVTGVVGLSNERFIFEGVHHSFHFCIATFRRCGEDGDGTHYVDTVFRINPREAISREALGSFLTNRENRMRIPLKLIKSLSPDSWSLIELQGQIELEIAEKMLRHPTLGESIPSRWNVKLSNEFHMTNDSHMFRTNPGDGLLPLYEGKMINQFSRDESSCRYWVNESERIYNVASTAKGATESPHLSSRVVMRRIARSTDTRTVISTLIPPCSFVSESLHVVKDKSLSEPEGLAFSALLNSYVVDFDARQRVNTNINMYLVLQLRFPRLIVSDSAFAPLVARTARLVATDMTFANLWNAAMADDRTFTAAEATVQPGEPPITRAWKPTCGATQTALRARLRAEIDGLVAHLYGLTEEEFAHILGTFPLVAEGVKAAARTAYRDVALGVVP